MSNYECEICRHGPREELSVCAGCGARVCDQCLMVLTIEGPAPGYVTGKTLCIRCLDKSTPLGLIDRRQRLPLNEREQLP